MLAAIPVGTLPLAGLTALVTGASSGIGRAIAEAFAQAGADVAVHYRSDEAGAWEAVGRITALGRKGLAVAGDLRREEVAEAAVAQTVAALGKLDILVNNAGALVKRVPLAETSVEFWDTIMDSNLKSAFLMSRAAFRHIASAGERGRLISIASPAAYDGGRSGDGVYAASKAGLISLTKAFATELAPHHATANILSPGITETPMLAVTAPAVMDKWIKRIPLGMGQPRDVAAGVVFLASASARWMTGSVVDMNGGAAMP